jgi:hypothetical protein
MKLHGRPLLFAVALAVSAGARSDAQEPEAKPRPEPKRPQLSLKVSPVSGMVPIRVVGTVELKGGTDDYQEYYCPTIEWNWDDGTISESSIDCEPYEAGKSQIRRRYTMAHNYKRANTYKVSFRLKNKQRVLAASSTVIRLIGGPY